MLVRYEFVNEVVEIEVDDKWGELLIDMDRQERNNNQTERRRHISLDMAVQDWDMQFADDQVLEEKVEQTLTNEQLQSAIAKLSPRYQKLLRQVFHEGRSIAAIARDERVCESSIRYHLRRIYKKLM